MTSAPDDLDPRLRDVRRQHCAAQLADLRMDYAILAAWNAGVTIRDIARAAVLSEDTVTYKVQSLPEKLPPIVEGRRGRRPLEVALRYAAGEIPWEQARDDLVTWPYLEEAEQEPWDDSYEFRPGAGSELFLAQFSYHYLTEGEYDSISNAIAAAEDADERE